MRCSSADGGYVLLPDGAWWSATHYACPRRKRRESGKTTDYNVVIEKKSKHKSLGFTYEINEMYHTCLCILFATLEMQRYSLKGISCCMGYGDYPIQF